MMTMHRGVSSGWLTQEQRINIGTHMWKADHIIAIVTGCVMSYVTYEYVNNLMTIVNVIHSGRTWTRCWTLQTECWLWNKTAWIHWCKSNIWL